MRGSGSVYKRCGCRDVSSGRQLGRHCPKLVQRGHGSWYFAAPRGYGRPLRRGGYATRDQARAALRALRCTQPLTVRGWLDQWLATRGRLRANTRRNYRYLFDQHLIPALGSFLLAELDLPSVQAAFDAMSRIGRGSGPLSASTLTRARTALNAAVRADLLPTNPARGVELPTPDKPHPVVWTPARIRQWQETGQRPPVAVWTAAQTAHFLASIRNEPLYPAFRLAALRGLRRGEISGLRWEDLGLDEATLSVVRQLHRRDGQFITGPPKSKASTRTIALDEDTVAVLRAHAEQQGEQGFVFTRADGQPLSPERLTRLIRIYSNQAELPPVRFQTCATAPPASPSPPALTSRSSRTCSGTPASC